VCTASWFFTGDSYQLFFNRDELRSRSIAQPPMLARVGSRNSLLPIDPDGGGSWIGVNDRGWSFALLNYYQGCAPGGELISRGSIVKGALACQTAKDVQQYLDELALERYAPFSLLCLAPPELVGNDAPPEQQPKHNSILMCRWNGVRLQRDARNTMITSSSRDFDMVVRTREHLAESLHETGSCARQKDNCQHRHQRHRQFHRSHGDTQSALSVCMHRSDACTVSYSEISVGPDCATFHYFAGAPCETDTVIRRDLRRQL